MKSLGLFFTLLCLCSCSIFGQDFYTVDNKGNIAKVTLTGTTVTTSYMSACGISQIVSIALSGSTIYFNTMTGSLYKADITSSGIVNCRFITSMSGNPANALTVDRDGNVYYASTKQLYKYDPVTKTSIYLGDMPSDPSGDMMFYKSSLYVGLQTGIYKIDLNDPSQSPLKIATMGVMSVYGMVNVKVGSITKTYALTYLGSVSGIVEIDLENGTIGNQVGTLPYTVYDSASENEDGGIPPIAIETTAITQECDYYNKGYIEVTAKTHTGTYTYSLNTGETNTTGIFHILEPDDYELTVTADNGAEDLKLPITIPDYSLNKPVSSYTTRKPICDVTGTIQFKVESPGSYNIRFNAQIFPSDHAFDNLLPAYYHFTILDQKNCIIDTIGVDLTATDPCNPVVFPNAFTPNGDGINDIFKADPTSRANQYNLMLYNRYGALVFNSRLLSQGWDGNTQGKPMPTGTYYWMVTYIDEYNKPAMQKGYVTLMR